MKRQFIIPRRAGKAHLIAKLSRGLRPRLTRDQQLDLDAAHVVNLDLIAKGQADEEVLWQFVGGTLTWHRVAQLLGLGGPEMHEQLLLADRLVKRFSRTSRVGFDGPDYQAAKDGLDVMKQLASAVDRATAIAAADWSETLVSGLAARGAAAAEILQVVVE